MMASAARQLATFVVAMVTAPLMLMLLLLCCCGGLTPDAGVLASQAPDAAFNAWNPGARCVSRAEYIDSIVPTCRGYIPHDSIYIDQYQAFRDDKITERQNSIISNNYCILKQIQIYCAEVYRPCYIVDIPPFGPTAVAGFVCNAFCDDRTRSCIPIYSSLPISAEEVDRQLSCTVPYPYDFGHPLSPIFVANSSAVNGTYTTEVVVWDPEDPDNTVVTSNVSLTCYDANKDIFAGWPTLYCPEGSHAIDSFTCEFDCPEPILDDVEYDAAFYTVGVIGWISFVLTAFVVVSYLLSPKEKLTYPGFMTFYFIVCVMCLSFSFCLGIMVGRHDLWCEDDLTPKRWGDGWCTIQGITYVYFTLAGGLWWLAIGLSLFVKVAFNYSPTKLLVYEHHRFPLRQSHLIQIVLHCICWGVPLIVTIIVLSAHRLGYGGSDFWCTIHSGETVKLRAGYVSSVEVSDVSEGEEVDIWNLILLTIPMLIISLIGTILLILVVLFAWIRSKEGWKFLLHQWRLLALMVLYIWIYSFVFSHHVAVTAQRRDQYDEYSFYITCLKRQFSGPEPLNCTLTSTINYPLWIIAAINASAQGVFVFFIYGTARGVYKAWAQLFRRVPGFPSSQSGSNPIVGTKLETLNQTTNEGDTTARDSDYEDDVEMEDAEDNDEDEEEEQSDPGKDNTSGDSDQGSQ